MKKFILPAFLLSMSSFTMAQEGKNLYGGIEYGASRISGQAQEIANALVSTVGGSATVTQDLGAYTGRLFVGYRLDEKWSVEGGFFRSGDFKISATGRSGAGVAYSVNGAIDAQGVDLSAVYFPMATKASREGFFFRGGLHSSSVEFSSNLTIGGQTTRSSSKDSGMGYLFGIGYDWNFGNGAFLRTSITRLMKLGGESDSDATYYAVGVGMSF
jgi:hypothetical protein